MQEALVDSSRGVRALGSHLAALTGPGLLWGGESTRWGSCMRVSGVKSPLQISLQCNEG